MTNPGLYVVDKTLDNGVAIGFEKNTWRYNHKVWPRTAIMYNGNCIATTVGESSNTPKCGVYMKDGNLMCNGEMLIQGFTENRVCINENKVTLGNIILHDSNNCINITKNNYNKLRYGLHVEGYAPYSEDKVYYITTDENLNTLITYDAALVKNHTDIIYNSFIPTSLGGVTDAYTDNAVSLITESNFTDPKHVPEIAMRYFDVFLKDEDGGAKLELEYYVDTCDYSANCIECVDEENEIYEGIGDLFTTIVENAYGEEIFRRTTYAGQFKVKIPLIRVNNDITNGDHITGKTFFTIRTIDDSGRESVTLFYEVFVKTVFVPTADTPEDTYDEEGKYLMTAEDLDTYGISTFKFNEGYSSLATNPDYNTDNNKATIDGRADYFSAYKNKLALRKLMDDKKTAGYTGLVLYNENTTVIKDFNDHRNTVYPIDIHAIDSSKNLTVSNYTLAQASDYPRIAFGDIVDYYLLKFIIVSGVNGQYYKIINPFNNEEIQRGNDYRYHLNDLDGCKIASGKTVYGTNYTVNTDESPYDFVRRDGAHTRRDINGKIPVVWNYNLTEEEVYGGKYVHWADTPALRLRNIDTFLTKTVDKLNNAIFAEFSKTHDAFNIDDGTEFMCYFSHRDFIRSGETHPYHLVVPDDFTLDCNGCTLISTYAEDANDCNMCVVSVSEQTNAHVKNGKIVGIHGDERVKDAFLKSNILGKFDWTHNSAAAINTMWEGGATVRMQASTLCSYENIWIENSGGYDFTMGPGYKLMGADYSSSSKKSKPVLTTIKTLRYRDYEGEIQSATVLVDRDGNSLIPTYCKDYTDGGARYTGLITSDIVGIGESDVKLGGTTRYGDYKTFTAAKDGIRVMQHYDGQTNGLPDATLISKHPTLFIHFYDSSSNHIKTYRINEREHIMPPLTAAKASITTYALFDSNGTIIPPENNTYQVCYNLWNPNIVAWDYPNDCSVRNCKVTIAKASMICGPAVNTSFVDCTFRGSAGIYGRFSFNNLLHNNEDQKGMASGFSYINCNNFEREDGMFISYTGLQQGMSERSNVVNCKGIDFCGNTTRYYIKDCLFNLVSCSANSEYFNNYLGIVKNSTSNMISSYPGGSRTGFLGGGSDENVGRSTRNVCYDPVKRKISVENCLFRINKDDNHKLYSRAYAYVNIQDNLNVETQTIDKA